MIRLSTVGITMISLLLSFSGAIGGQRRESAAVRLRIVDVAGRDLGEANVEEFAPKNNEADLAKKFRRNAAFGIPFGVYHLRAGAAGFWSAQRDVRVFQPDVWVVMQLDLGMGTTEGGLQTFSLSGSVSGLRSISQPVWLRAVGVYSGVIVDAKVDDDTGHFALAGLPQGAYVVITVQAGRVLDTRSAQIPTASPLHIDLRR